MLKGKFYSIQEVAEMTGLQPNSVRRACLRGKLKFEKMGSIYLIRQRDFDLWQQTRQKRPNALKSTKAAAQTPESEVTKK